MSASNGITTYTLVTKRHPEGKWADAEERVDRLTGTYDPENDYSIGRWAGFASREEAEETGEIFLQQNPDEVVSYTVEPVQ